MQPDTTNLSARDSCILTADVVCRHLVTRHTSLVAVLCVTYGYLTAFHALACFRLHVALWACPAKAVAVNAAVSEPISARVPHVNTLGINYVNMPRVFSHWMNGFLLQTLKSSKQV